MALNIPDSTKERLVIIGAGFAGLQLAKKLKLDRYQLVILDRNNFHQFQPLFYQVAMSGLEPSSIAFPLRKMFQRKKDVHIRPVNVERVDCKTKRVHTDAGEIYYDQLIIATGAKTNFFGQSGLEQRAFSLKSISEALFLRNQILSDLEVALTHEDYDARQPLIDVVIVGGGPTGVEIAGALAEMKKYIVPKDYVELDSREIDIHLVQAGDRLLNAMSEHASSKAEKFLKDLGVTIHLNKRVTDFDGVTVSMDTGESFQSRKVIWCAGVTADRPDGLAKDMVGRGGRIIVDGTCKVIGMDDVYAIGDVALMMDADYPEGHPQVAQVAIQQAKYLAKQFNRWTAGEEDVSPFRYVDKGSMATIGRHRAVADLPNFKFSGLLAWLVWLVVHLFALIGVKNKVFVFINWLWNYLTYDQSLRLIIRPFQKKL